MQKSSFRVAEKLVKSSAKSPSLRYKHGAVDDDSIQSGRFSPTDAIPGTQEKLRVLVERIESGLPLWHPADRSTDILPALVDDNTNHSNTNQSNTNQSNTICSGTSHSGTSHSETNCSDTNPSGNASNLDELFGLCGESDEQFN